MKAIVILILSFVCFSAYSQEILVINENTGIEHRKDLSDIVDTSLTKVIPDLKSNLKVYTVIREDRPSYDRLTERLKEKKTFIESIPEGEVYPVCVYSWDVVSLDDETIRTRKELAVIQKELNLIINQVPEDEFRQFVIMGLAALIHETRGGTLNADHNEILDIIFNRGLKVYQNRENKEQLLQDLQTDPDTDIGSGWVE